MSSLPTPARQALLRRAFDAAVQAADPVHVLSDAWPEPPEGRLIVLALGKAAAAMAAAAETHYAPYGARVDGVAVVPYGHAADTRQVRVMEAGHPRPDAASEAAARALLKLAGAATERDLVLVLVSGGGSALAVAPDGVDLDGLGTLVEALLASGAPIEQINAVRRRLDRIKGGGLAVAAHPAPTVALVVSDVVGDDPLAVASGPTVGDPGTAEEALRILQRYDIEAPAARGALQDEAAGRREGPPAPDDPRLALARTRVVAGGARSLEAAASVFEDAGVPARIVSDAITGDAREAARRHAAWVRGILDHGEIEPGDPCPPPVVLLSGGETTVAVRGDGQGGRNSAFALALALALPDTVPLWALCADSDGIDGVGGHAGAFVDPGLFVRLSREEARRFDEADDSRAAFARADALFETGPTRTNVNDLRFLWIDPATTSSGSAKGATKKDATTKGASATGASASAVRLLSADEAGLAEAARRLREGGLVAFPTETVYGLGARARDDAAVREVFRAKGRPADHPLIVHLPHAAALGAWVESVPEAAVRLAHAFWPGPLTLILPRAAGVPDAVTGGQDTVGVRVPDHPVALALLERLDDGIAAPSANRYGRLSPTRAQHVQDEFSDLDLAVLDGGACEVGLESTILDLSGEVPRLLRPGGASVADLESVLGTRIAEAGEGAPRAPGRAARHYAPATPMTVLTSEALAREGAVPADAGLVLRVAPPPAGHQGPSVRLPGDPAGYGRMLYAALRELDAAAPPRIAVETPPDGPGWRAVHDRLRRAAAGRGDRETA